VSVAAVVVSMARLSFPPMFKAGLGL
jgi:hypothetical protein